MASFGQTVIAHILNDQTYAGKVIQHIKPNFFEIPAEQTVYSHVKTYYEKYEKVPPEEVLVHIMEEMNGNQKLTSSSLDLVASIAAQKSLLSRMDDRWLLNQTEMWCKKQAMRNALSQSVDILDGAENLDEALLGMIPMLMMEATAISFDTRVGQDIFDDVENHWLFFANKADKIPCDLDAINYITKGGFMKKTLNLILAGTGAGKSHFLCHLATSFMKQGKNVLYITLEMSEEQVLHRTYSNLLGLPSDDLEDLSMQRFKAMVEEAKKKCGVGKLKVKEYPSGQANVQHFDLLLKELHNKQAFTPDIVIVDYLGIMAAVGAKDKSNLYSYGECCAVELRGWAAKNNVVCITANQFNRGGNNNTEAAITDIAGSFGIAFTMDISIALIRTDELDAAGQILCKQIKNRYWDMSRYPEFKLGVDRDRQLFFNVGTTPEHGYQKKQNSQTAQTVNSSGAGLSGFPTRSTKALPNFGGV